MITKDVLIIGAGAAGSTAAFHLALAGKKVVIVEKSVKLSTKQCGGGVASSIQKWFPFDLEPKVEEIIKTVEFSWCLKDRVTANLGNAEPFWIVRREELDEFIREHAVNLGVELIRPFNAIDLKRDNNIWKTTSSEGIQIEAKTVIIADGSASPWPQKFKIGPQKPHFASTLSLRLKGRGTLKNGTARFEFGLVRNGFAWAFPMNDEINLGIGTFLDENIDIKSELILKKILPSLGFNYPQNNHKLVSLRVWNGHSQLHGSGILAVGDAASLCDPFLAEGIRPAILSGYEAAKTINLLLDGDIEDLSPYTNSIKHNWGKSMAWGKRISQVFYRLPKIGYNLGVKRPTAPERIAQILSGKMSYEDIAQRVIKRLLFQRN